MTKRTNKAIKTWNYYLNINISAEVTEMSWSTVIDVGSMIL